MRKETFNSFAKGMSKDYNPLVVGKESYTDCLNGTLITYNGNEMSLQNDMGNAEIGTAFLPDGYVPVGMKEHGGIIYVAAYNPAENKSQIGCFPSPQQIFVDEATECKDDLNIASILKQITVGTSQTANLILKNLISSLLYKQKDNTYRTFHAGDQFIVTLPQATLNGLSQYITDGVIQFKLAVVTDSGNVEYIDDSKLRKYTSTNSWIYGLDNPDDLDTVITKDENMQVFRGNSSGKLMVVVMYKVCDNFEVSRKYKYTGDNALQITFTGKYDGGISNSILYKNSGTYSIAPDSYAVTGANIVEYEIYPGHENYGYEERLKISGSIDIDTLKQQQSMLSNIYYYVELKALRLHWSYDYIDINDEQPSCIKFKFYNLAEASLTGEGESRKVTLPTLYYEYIVTKDIYNGDFTDRIPFSRGYFDENTVYYCEIEECKEGSNPKLIKSLYIYTGKFFNQFDLKQLSGYILGEKQSDVIYVLPKITLSCAEQSFSDRVYINKDKIHSSTNNLYSETGKYADAMFELVSDGNLDVALDSTYKDKDCVFITKVSKQYKLTPSISVNAPDKIDANGVIFSVDDLVFDTSKDFYENIDYTLSTNIVDNTETIGTSTGYLPNDPSTCTKSGENTYDVKLNRSIWAKGANTKAMVEVERLMPYYDEISGYSTEEERNKVFGFREVDNDYVTCIAATDKMLYHNSKLQTNQINKSLYNDVKGGECGGCDQEHLSRGCAAMGGTINIFGGTDGDEASYSVRGRDINRKSGYAWGNGDTLADSEVDPGDNYLLACWKQTDTDYKLLNIGSRKYYDINANDGVPERHSVQDILRCICSLLLVAKTFEMYQDFIKPDVSNLAYHTNFKTEVKFTCTTDETDILINKDLHDKLKVLADEKNITDYIPKFYIEKKSTTNFTHELGEDFKLDTYVDQYLLAQHVAPGYTTLTPENRMKVYIGEVTSIDDRGICNLKTDELGMYKIADGSKFTFWISLLKDKTSVGFGRCMSFRKMIMNTQTHLPSYKELSLGDIFITRAEQLLLYGAKLPKDFYNEVCLKEGAAVEQITSKFTKHNKEHAPDMYLLPILWRETKLEYLNKLNTAGDTYSVYTSNSSKLLRHLYIYSPETIYSDK